jgi:hypothetical protein
MSSLYKRGMQQAIVTKYQQPTDTRGAAIVATAAMGERVRMPLDHSLDAVDNHYAAALKLKHKLDWKGELLGGSLKDGYAWVLTSR